MSEKHLKPVGPGLTDDQVRFFHTFGYVVLKQLFTPEELHIIDQEFAWAMEEQYSHQPYDGANRHWTAMMDGKTPFFASLNEDPRFLTPAKQLFGDDVLGIAANANRYTGDTHWHRDTVSVLQNGVKFAYYLEPVDKDSGALRVIPGTHRLPDDKEFDRGVQPLNIEEVPATALVSEPGDVVAFDVRLWHSSVGGSTDRRMCTVIYYTNPKTTEEVEYLRKQGEINVNASYKQFGCKRQYLYSTDWLANPKGNPDRRWWIERLREVGYLDAPGLVETV